MFDPRCHVFQISRREVRAISGRLLEARSYLEVDQLHAYSSQSYIPSSLRPITFWEFCTMLVSPRK